MRCSTRLMRNSVVIVFSVCSRANMEHVAAVRESGGLQCLVQSCQIRFRPLTGCGSRRKAWQKWNPSICAEREGSADHWIRIWSRSAEWSCVIHSHALSGALAKAETALTFVWFMELKCKRPYRPALMWMQGFKKPISSKTCNAANIFQE